MPEFPFALSVGGRSLAIHGHAALGHPAHCGAEVEGSDDVSTPLAARATLNANGN